MGTHSTAASPKVPSQPPKSLELAEAVPSMAAWPERGATGPQGCQHLPRDTDRRDGLSWSRKQPSQGKAGAGKVSCTKDLLKELLHLYWGVLHKGSGADTSPRPGVLLPALRHACPSPSHSSKPIHGT